MNKNDLKVEYLGFLSKEELYKVVSKAKLLVYPSLADGFSLVILEAITLGTPAISYNFPPIYTSYKDVPAVRFSPINNNQFSKILYNSLNDEKFLYESVNDEKTLSFIKTHS
ncbi:glycosyltransferase [Acidianus sulfidivorans]|uniref:glycosyltransferase n=1 Tax=Acidianus sulfidivorans TaxID=312539 RepID=UPI0030B82C39